MDGIAAGGADATTLEPGGDVAASDDAAATRPAVADLLSEPLGPFAGAQEEPAPTDETRDAAGARHVQPPSPRECPSATSRKAGELLAQSLAEAKATPKNYCCTFERLGEML